MAGVYLHGEPNCCETGPVYAGSRYAAAGHYAGAGYAGSMAGRATSWSMAHGAGVVGGPVYGPGYAGGSHVGGGYAGGGYAGGGDACVPGDGCGPAGAAACGAAGCAGCGVGCGGIAGTTMAVVGEGCGDYVASTTYKYVGMGAGNMGLVPIPGPSCSCWWSLCFLWLLPLLLLIPSTTTTTTTTTTATFSITTPTPPPDIVIRTTTAPDKSTTTQGQQGYCKIFGDPHVVTFDGSHASFYSQGEYWAVKSDTVWMQGRYLPNPVTNGLSVMKELCIGGPFLESRKGKKNKLCVSALAAFFNGAPIIPGFPDSWSHVNPKIEVTTDASGQVLQASRTGKPLHVVHIRLPLDIEVQINRWNEPGEGDYINALIRMGPQPNQDGHCGNFNGNPADDTRPLIRSRIGTTGVDPAELLYDVKTPVSPANRPDLNNCPTDKTEMAKTACANSCKNGIPSKECMIDVCFGGPQFAEMTEYDC